VIVYDIVGIAGKAPPVREGKPMSWDLWVSC